MIRNQLRSYVVTIKHTLMMMELCKTNITCVLMIWGLWVNADLGCSLGQTNGISVMWLFLNTLMTMIVKERMKEKKGLVTSKRVCVGKCESVYGWVYEARVLHWKGFGLDVVMLTSSGLHGSLFPSSLPKAPGCLCMTSSPKHAPLKPPANLPVVTPIETCCSATHTFFCLSLSFLPLLLPFLFLLFSDNPLPFSLTRRRHCLGRGPDQKKKKKPSPPKPLPFCKFNKPTLKICLINGWHLWLEQRRGILLWCGHCWPPN